MLSKDLIETLAWKLKASSTEDVAFLVNGNTVYYSRFKSLPQVPSSAIVQLIQGIYETQPDHARALLRNRIYTTATPTEMCLGMISVAAKRLTSKVLPISHKLPLSYQEVEVPRLTIPSQTPGTRAEILQGSFDSYQDQDFMQLARTLAANIPRSQKRFQSDRPIAALLVSKENRILTWATNSNSKNKTLHAEVNLIQSYYQIANAPLPPYSKIYTTLKSCKMCSGMIWNAAQDLTSLKVYFGENDLGPKGKMTVLTLGTPDRQRASHTQNELHLEIEHALDKE